MPYDNDQILIFKAKLISDFPADQDREFMIQYFLKEQMLQITENKSPKNGFSGGRFLNKMKVKNPETNNFYGDRDFSVGSILEVSGRTFELVDAPEYTYCLMESTPEKFIVSDMQYSVEKLGQFANNNGIDLSSVFDSKDPANTSFISKSDIEQILFSYSPAFPKHCAMTIIRRFTDKDKFDYVALLRYLDFSN